MSKLTKRQKSIVDASKKAKTTIDVGCDHGFVGVNLLETGKTKFLIASDISEKCASKAHKLLEEKNLLNKADVRVGSGIVANLNEKIDQAIIAGMGGHMIWEIIKDFSQAKKIKHFVLQPMKEVDNLRMFLNENGFKILKDFVVEDKSKFYHIITAKPGKQKLSKIETKWGLKSYKKNPKDYFLWLEQKKEKIEKILSNLQKDNEKSKFLVCLKEIEEIKLKRSKLC